MAKNANAFGFTVVELLVTVLVVAVLATTALPAFTALVRDNRMATQANELLSAVMYARSEAGKRHEAVRVCGGSSSCSGSWRNGWIAVEASSGDVLRRWSPLEPGMRLAARAYGGASGDFVEYRDDGTVDAGRSLVLCDARGASAARALNIAATGRATMARRHAGRGATTVVDVRGNDITCP